MKKSKPSRRNPVAKAVRGKRPAVIPSKKKYSRKKREANHPSDDDYVSPDMKSMEDLG